MNKNVTSDPVGLPSPPKTRADFKALFRGTNFMTPYVLRYGELTLAGGRTAYYELSFGPGLGKGTLWGVTVRDQNGKSLATDPSNCFASLETAETYIRSLDMLWVDVAQRRVARA